MARKIMVAKVAIGGTAPITVQSMTTTLTHHVDESVRQIRRLERAGCDLIRVAILDKHDAAAIGKIKGRIAIPLIADIHFDYRLALAAIEHGADKIRLNPGNIRGRGQIEAVIDAAKSHRIPIRIGLNSGSVPRQASRSLLQCLTQTAKGYLNIFRRARFDQIVFSVKTPQIDSTVAAYRQIAAVTDAPLHLGITAAGMHEQAMVKSSIGIGLLLAEGIGDTIRVSLSAPPLQEVRIGKAILEVLQLRNPGIEILSCPTCGRCTIDLIDLVKKAERRLRPFKKVRTARPLRVAIMGCVVNGPGEAREADIGIAWGGGRGMLFKKGRQVRRLDKKELLDVLYREVAYEMGSISSPHA